MLFLRLYIYIYIYIPKIHNYMLVGISTAAFMALYTPNTIYAGRTVVLVLWLIKAIYS